MLQFDVVNGKQPALNDFFRSHDVVQMGKEPYRGFFETFQKKEEALRKDSEQQWLYSLMVIGTLSSAMIFMRILPGWKKSIMMIRIGIT